MIRRRSASLLLLPLLLVAFLCNHQALAQDLAVYKTPQKGDNVTSVRQKVCERYLIVQNGTSELKDALSGMELRPILTLSRFFHYNTTHGIDETNPGLAVQILDELAREERANFTWRNSFAVTPGPEGDMTWTEALELYTETFDISIDYWDKNTDRLNRGIAFLDQWFDGNMILIEKVEPVEEDDNIDFLNFMKPFTWGVWYATFATIIVSGFIYQWLEFLNNERDERTFWQWCEDNLYLSSMNFTQQYMYEPTSSAARIFGFSMAVWAMVMGATYTANLASLFVEDLGEPVKIADIDQAIRMQYKICTWKDTSADMYIGKRYPQALRVRMATELEAYQGLYNGRCKVTIGALATWKGYEMDKDYNKRCDLEWVGKTVEEVSSAFTVKADPAVKCTNLIRDVLNYHLSAMVLDDTMKTLWDEYYASNENKIDCATYEPGDELEEEALATEDSLTRRLLSTGHLTNNPQMTARQLKGGGGANPAAAVSGDEGDGDGSESSLDIQAMAGTFVLHALLSALSILVGTITWYRKKLQRAKLSITARIEDEDTSSINDDLALTPEPISGMPLASGRCGKGYRVDSVVKRHGTVEEQMQALFETQKELRQNQENMGKQMELVVAMLTKMQENDQRSTTATEASSSLGGYLFSSK